MTQTFASLTSRFGAFALVLGLLVGAPSASAGLLRKLVVPALGTAAVLAAIQHEHVHNTPLFVGKDLERYNAAYLARAKQVQARAPARELSAQWGERGTMLCGPYVLFASFSNQLNGESFKQFVDALEERKQWGLSPDYGMKPVQLISALRDLGFGEGISIDPAEKDALRQLYAEVDAGKLVAVMVDEQEVWPDTSVVDYLSGKGKPRLTGDAQGAPHLVRVVGLQRDRKGEVAQVLLYDVNHPNSTLSVRQFQKVMASTKPVFHAGANKQLILATSRPLEPALGPSAKVSATATPPVMN